MPNPLQVIQDTREQKPWTWPKDKVTVTKTALKTGDYSLVGYEDRIVVERKSLADLINTLTAGRTRFAKELTRMDAIEFKCVIVEGSFCQIPQKAYRSRIDPRALTRLIVRLDILHGVPVYFFNGRKSAKYFAIRWMDEARQSIG